MLINCFVREWHKRSGADAYGQPELTLQAGQWCGQHQAKTRRLADRGGREVVSTSQVLVFRAPPISVGDRVTIRPLMGGGDTAYEVLAVETNQHPVLGYQLLVLGA
jgi:hypothetical protein